MRKGWESEESVEGVRKEVGERERDRNVRNEVKVEKLQETCEEILRKV